MSATTAPPRLRFCPAPSGWLHVGSVRAALYNWLQARHDGGRFILRIEDTDASRATEQSTRSMIEALDWMGLDWDEGPVLGADGALTERGAYGPYRQSERAALYAAVVRRLDTAGHTYRDYRTAEELQAWREAQRAGGDGGPPVVKAETFEHDPERIAMFVEEGRSPSLRLRTPASGTIVIDDLVRGEVRFDWATISDPVIQRSDGSATYPLANSVDDVAQGIDLICRGEDLLSVTPRQVLIHQMLVDDGLLDEALAEVGLPSRDPSWQAPSRFAHLPMVVGMDRKKLSKRHGSVAVQEFRRQGFLPEALRNYLALLGWSPADGRERLTDAEMIETFDLTAVGRSAAAFDVDKLTAFNGERIRELDPVALAQRLVPYLDGTLTSAAAGDEANVEAPVAGVDGSPPVADREVGPPGAANGGAPGAVEPLVSQPPTAEQRRILEGLVPLVQERMQRLDEIQRYAAAFLRTDVEFDPASVDKVLRKAGSVEAIAGAREVLAEVDWTLDGIEAALRTLPERLGIGFGKVAQPVRVAVTGSSVSPPLFESIELLGRERTLDRLAAAEPVATQARASAG